MRDIGYFGQIISHYLILALNESGVNVVSDTYAELDSAIELLSETIRELHDENRKLAARVAILEGKQQ